MLEFLRARKRELISIGLSLCFLLLGIFIKNHLVSFLSYATGYLLSGWRVIYKAFRGIFKGRLLDENFLMTLATFGAIAIGEYAEAIFVMIFYVSGELFEKSAVAKSREAITSLMDMCPESVNLLRDGEISEKDPYEAEIGDTVVVKAGERIALDGIVISGESYLNTSALTGESVPVFVRKGDAVMSGSINENGVLYIEVTRIAEDSTVSRILELIENSVERRSRCESFITRFAKYYTPCVVACALLVALLPPLLWNASWIAQIRSAMVFLMISCPCALVISVPLTFFGGIGSASKRGILVKGSNYLEELEKIKTVAFDKTGTLTHGKFTVSKIISHLEDEEILYYAAYAENFSDHPIARSLRAAYGKEINRERISFTTEIAGVGVIAEISGDRIAVGNARILEHLGIVAALPSSEFGSIVHVIKNQEYLGSVVISDSIKESAHRAIARLKSLGVRTVMLSGDRRAACEYVSKELGIDEFYGELMPDQKLDVLDKLIEKSKKEELICFVGDGINDAPVLAAADVSVAMGGLGSDAAVEAADVVLIDDDPEQVARALELSKRVNSIARQNVIFSLSVKFAVLVLGAFGLAGIWEAVFSDVGVSVIAILNAIRTLKIKNK